MSIPEELNKIMELALEMCERKVANVFVHYSGHVNSVHVYAHPFDQDYGDYDRTELVDKRVDFDCPSEAIEELKAVRKQIEQLPSAVPEPTGNDADGGKQWVAS
ncbi:hypothetical protein [Marinobacter sp. BGYM27]|uniref:hypothetical protein n=1 Tax=Marinobacter sp. BGYM27 TaxID=2975597 RepID=UPI0021A85D9C|nr:hypothetical protein [Marinobacter sp. BGYM27]MDG5498929.1 hypothetical protein [Marinobacter sp. BGYM27]